MTNIKNISHHGTAADVKPLKIFAIEPIIADIQVEAKNHAKFNQYLVDKKYISQKAVDEGDFSKDKLAIKPEEGKDGRQVIKELQRLLYGEENTKREASGKLNFKDYETENNLVSAGATTANMLYNMHGLLGNKGVETNYYTTMGRIYGDILEKSLHSRGINMINMVETGEGDSSIPKDQLPRTARSLVMQQNGSKRILKYAGNAKDLITPEIINQESVSNGINNSDVVFLQGAAWQKFNKDTADEVMKKRWEAGKRLWISLPSDADFVEKDSYVDVRNHFNFVIPSAELVLSNEDELMRFFDITPNENASEKEKDQAIDIALQKIQHLFYEVKNVRNKGYDDEDNLIKDEGDIRTNEINGDNPQIAFITLGEKGAAIVSANGIEKIEPRSHLVNKDNINVLGAGDTATGSFLAAYTALNGLLDKDTNNYDKKIDNAADAAKFAMNVVTHNLKVTEAQIPNIDEVVDDIIRNTNSKAYDPNLKYHNPKIIEFNKQDGAIATKIKEYTNALGKQTEMAL